MAPATAAIMAALLAASSAAAGDTARHHSATVTAHQFPRGMFTHPQTNPYFPLVPGTITILRGADDGEHFRERVVVTDRTKLILGVHTRVVRDTVRRADGTLAEKTADWYAADNCGNIWYFGEATASYDEDGELESREGSWQAGVDGADAGLIMPARPRPTVAYRQEFYPGHAEDQAWIVDGHATTTVPLGRFEYVVRTFEWTRLEPGVVSTKLYARGIGIVRERDVAGGTESFVVTAVRRP